MFVVRVEATVRPGRTQSVEEQFDDTIAAAQEFLNACGDYWHDRVFLFDHDISDTLPVLKFMRR